MDSSSQLDDGSVISVFGVFGEESFLLESFTKQSEMSRKVVSVSDIVYITYTTSDGPHWDSRGFRLTVTVVTDGNALLYVTVDIWSDICLHMDVCICH